MTRIPACRAFATLLRDNRSGSRGAGPLPATGTPPWIVRRQREDSNPIGTRRASRNRNAMARGSRRALPPGGKLLAYESCCGTTHYGYPCAVHASEPGIGQTPAQPERLGHQGLCRGFRGDTPLPSRWVGWSGGRGGVGLGSGLGRLVYPWRLRLRGVLCGRCMASRRLGSCRRCRSWVRGCCRGGLGRWRCRCRCRGRRVGIGGCRGRGCVGGVGGVPMCWCGLHRVCCIHSLLVLPAAVVACCWQLAVGCWCAAAALPFRLAGCLAVLCQPHEQIGLVVAGLTHLSVWLPALPGVCWWLLLGLLVVWL